ADPGGADRSNVIIRVKYAGFCGSDRGIWWRKSFGDMILRSLDEERKDRRVVGHELLGEVVAVGNRVTEKYGYAPGRIVSTESHIVCGVCHMCRVGDMHVCADDRIIGISRDGCFAEYVKLPAKALWPTDLDRIRPEVAAIQEPFGNAVHACSATELRGQRVAIIGTGTIGLFAILIARGMGARQIIGIDVDPHHRELARRLGCDAVLTPALPPQDRRHASDPALIEQVRDLTDGFGVDVTLEMAGFNSALNNALKMTRRGGHVVMFGVQNGPAMVEDYHRVIMNGLQLHAVVGRRIFQTWEMTRALLENQQAGIQQSVWEVILNEGQGTLVDIDDWERDRFEAMIRANPKVLIRFAG
ncbi:MAG: alcohol dehydrogenase catalytic domain-containing protein, partial [Myxococcota bacterium]|nr:alcohol dehydrogenase catalytic domain-containing protein [Myxococcota bacterium]